VDFVVFDGLTAGVVKGVVFVELKSGGPRLSARQGADPGALGCDAPAVEWLTIKTFASGAR
jgi:predicted Holliday junction resolvase-like endonuclease